VLFGGNIILGMKFKRLSNCGRSEKRIVHIVHTLCCLRSSMRSSDVVQSQTPHCPVLWHFKLQASSKQINIAYSCDGASQSRAGPTESNQILVFPRQSVVLLSATFLRPTTESKRAAPIPNMCPKKAAQLGKGI
jgi:hypothetical protein